MKNKNVGFILLGISLLIGFIVYSFNRVLTGIIESSCSHGSECPMFETIRFQTNMSIVIIAFILFIGIYLLFLEQGKTESGNPKKKNHNKILSTLSQDSKIVMEKIINSEGTIFQSSLVEQTGFSKTKITRILDKLEGSKLIERRRRGMTNIVILK